MAQFAFFISVILTLAGDFVALVSPDQYRFEEDIKRQLTRLLKAPPNAFYDFFVHQGTVVFNIYNCILFGLFVLLLYVPSQQLGSWRDSHFT